MITHKQIATALHDAGDDNLKRAGIHWLSPDGPQDVDTALLIAEGSSSCTLLSVLRSLLCGETLDTLRNERIERDLKRWFSAAPTGDRRIAWLKVEIERYPMRLFVVCDWRDEENHSPTQDEFWFHMPEGVKNTTVPPISDDKYSLWHSPDPRPWKEPAWRRFLGKRICWLALDEVKCLIPLFRTPDGASEFMARYFPGFLHEGVAQSWELLPLWLRLKWVEHLARRVRGLDWSYLTARKARTPYGAVRLALGLDNSEHALSYRPPTIVPPEVIKRVYDLPARNAQHRIDVYPQLRPINLGVPLKSHTSVEFRWAATPPASAYGIMNLHGEAIIETPTGWEGKSLDAIEHDSVGPPPKSQSGLLFSGSLSGSLPSHNTLIALNRASQTHQDAWRLLEVIEHALLRVAVCDERVHAWCEHSRNAATNAILRRVFPVFLHEPSSYKQATKPVHGYWGSLRYHSGHWRLDLRDEGSENARGLLAVAFANDPWPVAAEVLLIHQGILDKWTASREVNASLELLDVKDEIPWIAVTSGRGKPEQIPYGVRFLPFTGLQACLINERFDKLLLIRQLAACGGEV
jgi:hypothetical protein